MDKAELKRLEVLGLLAFKASTGNRTFVQMCNSIKIELDGGDWLHIDTYGAEELQIDQALSDAAFIAAANPAIILALLARVEKLTTALELAVAIIEDAEHDLGKTFGQDASQRLIRAALASPDETGKER